MTKPQPLILKTSETHYSDNGQTMWRVHWTGGAITESPRLGAHMQALFSRAAHENAVHEVYHH